METKIARFFELKTHIKQLEEELDQIRRDLLQQYPDPCTMEIGEYKLVISHQERREYDENRLYNKLPDASLWRLLSKVDPAKVNSMLKVNVINEDTLQDTYQTKKVPLLKVQKK